MVPSNVASRLQLSTKNYFGGMTEKTHRKLSENKPTVCKHLPAWMSVYMIEHLYYNAAVNEGNGFVIRTQKKGNFSQSESDFDSIFWSCNAF